MKSPAVKTLATIVLPYAVVAGVWILVSDHLLKRLPFDEQSRLNWSIYKGWAFVLVTSILLYLLIRRELRAREQVESDLRRVNRALRTVRECDQHLVRANQESSLLDGVCRVLVEHGAYRMAWVGYAESDEAKSVRPVSQAGFEDGYLQSMRIVWADQELGRGPTGTSIRTGRPVIARNIPSDPDYEPWRAAAIRQGYGSSIALPLLNEGTPFGALMVYAAEANAFDEAEVALLLELSHDLSYGIAALRERRAREKAEASAHESEERLRLALDAARMGTFDWDIPVDRLTWSRWHEQLWGYSPGQFEGAYRGFADRVHPDDLPGLEAEVNRCMAARESFSREFRVLWPDGSTHWMLATGEFSFGPDGQARRMRGTVIETTERREGEEALRRSHEQLRALSARLENLREAERIHISREIHDELGQMLTGIKMDLRWTEHRLETLAPDPRVNAIIDRVVAAGELADATVRTVQRIAAALRPGILDKLGLGMALQYEAARFQERSGIPCLVRLPTDEPRLSPEITTAFFRIFQETLTNIARHAGATQVLAELRADPADCCLEIADNGRGLTGVDLANPRSLGLLGMQERARLLGGEVSFGQRPEGGTVVAVRIPRRPTPSSPS